MMDINDIATLVEKYGVSGTIFMLVLFLIFTSLKSEWFSDFFSKISDKFIEGIKTKPKENDFIGSITDSDITNHDTFNYIDFWTYSKIPAFRFSTDFRTAVFRKYLTIYLKSYKKNISKYVLSKEYQEMDQPQLSTSLLNLINTIVYDYEKEAREVGLPDVVIERMKSKNNDAITLTHDLIEGVCSSQFYTSEKNLLKVYSILNILLSVLGNTIANSKEVCDSINGQMAGLSFEGKIEPTKKH